MLTEIAIFFQYILLLLILILKVHAKHSTTQQIVYSSLFDCFCTALLILYIHTVL